MQVRLWQIPYCARVVEEPADYCRGRGNATSVQLGTKGILGKAQCTRAQDLYKVHLDQGNMNALQLSSQPRQKPGLKVYVICGFTYTKTLLGPDGLDSLPRQLSPRRREARSDHVTSSSLFFGYEYALNEHSSTFPEARVPRMPQLT